MDSLEAYSVLRKHFPTARIVIEQTTSFEAGEDMRLRYSVLVTPKGASLSSHCLAACLRETIGECVAAVLAEGGIALQPARFIPVAAGVDGVPEIAIN